MDHDGDRRSPGVHRDGPLPAPHLPARVVAAGSAAPGGPHRPAVDGGGVRLRRTPRALSGGVPRGVGTCSVDCSGAGCGTVPDGGIRWISAGRARHRRPVESMYRTPSNNDRRLTPRGRPIFPASAASARRWPVRRPSDRFDGGRPDDCTASGWSCPGAWLSPDPVGFTNRNATSGGTTQLMEQTLKGECRVSVLDLGFRRCTHARCGAFFALMNFFRKGPWVIVTDHVSYFLFQ